MLYSAGIDSYATWHLLWLNGIFFKCQGTQKKELEYIKKLNADFPNAVQVINQGKLYGERLDGYVPYRNLFFLLWANSIYPDKNIVINQTLEWQTDKNRKFYQEVEKMFKNLNGSNAKILTPFENLTKSELIELCLKHPSGLNFEKYSYSCLAGGEIHCGKCSSCYNRYIAFRNAKLPKEPMASKPTYEGWLKMKKSQGNYSLPILRIAYKRWREAKKAFAKYETN